MCCSVRPSILIYSKNCSFSTRSLSKSEKRCFFSLAFTWSCCWSSSYQYIKELFSLYIFTWVCMCVCVCIFIIVTTTLMLFLVRWITLHIFIRCLNISLITFIFHLVFFFFQLSSLIYLFFTKCTWNCYSVDYFTYTLISILALALTVWAAILFLLI